MIQSKYYSVKTHFGSYTGDRMPFLTDQVLFLLVLVDLRQAYFPLHRYHSVTFPSFLYT